MIVFGTMRMPLGHSLRRDLSRHIVFSYIPCIFGSSKVNYYSTSQAHHQYDARRVASSHPFFYRFPSYMDKTAIIDQHGSWKYRDLLQASCKLADELVDKYGQKEKQNGLNRARIGLFCDSDASLYIGMFAGWIAGAVVVPLYQKEGYKLRDHVYPNITDTRCSVVVTTKTYSDQLRSWAQSNGLQIHLLETKDFINQADEEFKFSTAFVGPEERFLTDLMINKSIDKDAIIWHIIKGSSKLNKNGIVLTFRNIMSNIHCDILRSSWNDNDTVLFTPHFRWDRLGSADVFVPLYFGATCLILPKYRSGKVLEELLTSKGSMAASNSRPVSKFYSTREVFGDILDIVDKDASGQIKKLLRSACDTRVKMVYLGQCFSLPHRWFKTLSSNIWVCVRTSISGEFLMSKPKMLERRYYFDFKGFIKPYVMGRIAVYHKEGFDIVYECIGDRMLKSTQSVHGIEGELQLKGDCVAARIFSNSVKMKERFYTHDGWLKTGFIARANVDGSITVLPKQLKYWIDKNDQIPASVVHVILRTHPAVERYAVFRRPNAKRGQTVAVAVVLKRGTSLSLKELHEYMRERKASKNICPSSLLCLKSMPYENFDDGPDDQALMNMILREDLHDTYDIEMMDS